MQRNQPSHRSAPLQLQSIRTRVALCSALIALACHPDRAEAQQLPAFEVFEASIPQLQAAMESGRVTSVDLVDAYLARIEAYDQQGPALNSILRINQAAREQARLLDQERTRTGPRGPLHGIPIVLKDNFDTADMPTTGGSIALATHQPLRDAFQVHKLREAGAVILAKTNLHEFAYGTTTISSLGGQTRNPYDIRRNPGGSSGGTGAAVAASFAAVGWAADTCGSIRIPAGVHNLVGLRPTKGLSSIDGILPLSHTQDVGGPLARSVTDLAIALDATIGPDPADPATAVLQGRTLPRFVEALDAAALRGTRIGVLRQYFGEAPEERETNRVIDAALELMKANGAEIVEVEIPELAAMTAGTSVIGLEFKFDLLDYLARTPDAPVSSLGEVIASGQHHEALTNILRSSDQREARLSDALTAALAKREQLHTAILAFLDRQDLDVLAYPTLRREAALIGDPAPANNCQVSAATGMPALTLPAGFSQRELPVGLELLGRRFADERLVALAYAFELAVQPRRAPPFTPALVDGRAPAPVEFVVVVPSAGGSGGAARATFRYDRSLGNLDYRVEGESLAMSEVTGVVLRSGASGPILHRLVGPGGRPTSGELTLELRDRRLLEGGDLRLQLFTDGSSDPVGEVEVRLPN